MKTAIFGGAFNPVHNGHIALAKYLKEKINADRVLIMPSFLSPHKSSAQLISTDDRLEMCRLAFGSLEGFEVSDIEIKRQGISYTSDTLTQLKSLYPNDELYLFCGADMFMTLTQWHRPDIIFSLCTLCTVPRNDVSADILQKKAEEYEKMGAKCLVFDAPLLDISSSELRSGKKSELIPQEILEFIKTKGLYNGKI